MIQTSTALYQKIWLYLETTYGKFTNAKGGIPTEKNDLFVLEVLSDLSRSQQDYMVRNLWRLDGKMSGIVTLKQIGNLILWKYCGQICLQRQHKNGKITHAAQRNIKIDQFSTILSLALGTLHVDVILANAEQIFSTIDTNKDGLISYVEYIEAFQKSFYKRQGLKEQITGDKGPERRSKIRRFVWDNLRRVFNLYVRDRNLLATEQQLRGLVCFIIEGLSQNQLRMIVDGLSFGLGGGPLHFQSFASLYLVLVAQTGLSRFAINHNPCARGLVKQDMPILTNTFGFCDWFALKWELLENNFEILDKDADGFVQYDEYMDWVRNFVAVQHLYGKAFYQAVDDMDVDPSGYLTTPQKPNNDDKKVSIDFQFTDHSLGKQIRLQLNKQIQTFDKDNDNELGKEQIDDLLTNLLKINSDDLKYVSSSIFRFDRNNDGEISFHQLSNFLAQFYLGEYMIDQFTKTNRFTEADKRRMNRKQFGNIINTSLSFTGIQASQGDLDHLFTSADVGKSGWISFQVYTLFLRFYFGADSIAALQTMPKETEVLNADQKFIQGLKELNPIDRFSKTIIQQLKDIFYRFDYNKNKVFQYEQVRDILDKVFRFDSNELNYLLMKYFSFDAAKGGAMTFQQLIALILTIYFTQILFKKKYGNTNSKNWVNIKINLADFTSFFTEFCFFIKLKPGKEDLAHVFNQIDSDHDSLITFTEYSNLIKKHLGNNIDLTSSKLENTIAQVTQDQVKLVQSIWTALKEYFDKNDQGNKGFLNESELHSFVNEVLQQASERQLNYVFWNIFRVDFKSEKEFRFQQFAPFLLSHAGEIALQRFHKQHFPGKVGLSFLEFYKIFYNAYSIMPTIPREMQVIRAIYERIKTQQLCGYPNFLNWVNRSLVVRHRK